MSKDFYASAALESFNYNIFKTRYHPFSKENAKCMDVDFP